VTVSKGAATSARFDVARVVALSLSRRVDRRPLVSRAYISRSRGDVTDAASRPVDADEA